MSNSSEPSSSLSFTSSSDISNGSTGCGIPSSSTPEPRSNLEIISLNKLSKNLEKLLADCGSDFDYNYSDAEVVVEGISVGIHRCILATRSKFFSYLFRESKGCVDENGKAKYIMSEMLPYGNVEYDAFLVFLSYVYTGKLKSLPSDVSTCVDDGCHHDACRPAINFAVELTYASSVFQVPKLVSLFQRHLLNFVDKALVEDVIPILTVAFDCQLKHVLSRCIDRVTRSNLDSTALEKELPFFISFTANSSEPSSSLSFTSSSDISNGSTRYTIPSSSTHEKRSNLEIISLNKLSTNLEKLLADCGSDSDSDYSDAQILVEGYFVGIHRCILATRSKFFSDLFRENKGCVNKDGKPKYVMSEMLPYGNVGYEAFLVFLSYVYTGKLKSLPPEVSTCVDDGCHHDACRPAIHFAVELTYASSVFQVPELISLFQRHLLNFVDKALVADVIPILTVAYHCQLKNVLCWCIDRVAGSNFDSISLEKELPFEVVQDVKLRANSQEDDEHTVESEGSLRERRIKLIHKALYCNDIELVKMILSESIITLDEACALHYVVLYCDEKVAKETLDLNQADVNLRNSQGYTVLHVAAMRKEPSIIVSLLSKGARALDTTVDGQSAVSICRRLTRPKDYNLKVEHGKETNKDRICIDVLEREMNREPMIGDVSVCSSAVAGDLHIKLLYLENRVALARLLFPSEGKLAMEIAQAQTTSQYPGLLASKGSNGDMRKMEALTKTVETGRRYFPHCSEILDKFMTDDLQDLIDLEKDTSKELEITRTRFFELKEDVQRAFKKDKAELHGGLYSSMYSPMMMHRAKNKYQKYS